MYDKWLADTASLLGRQEWLVQADQASLMILWQAPDWLEPGLLVALLHLTLLECMCKLEYSMTNVL
jgi:hypothetical protein